MPRETKFASSINEKHHTKSRFQNVILNDIDKGRGCRNCGDSCPGLQLHVWRKICQFCSCPWEAHDVEIVRRKPKRKTKPKTSSTQTKKGISFVDTPEIIPSLSPAMESTEIKIVLEDFSNEPKVDLIISQLSLEEDKDSTKILSPESPLSPVDNYDDDISPTSQTSEDDNPDFSLLKEKYLWYPMSMNFKNVESFMASLPPELRPIKGTQAAQNCKNVLLRQLPPQDTDHLICHPLSEKEFFLMQKFVEQRENKYRGQGIVQFDPKGDCVSCKQQFIPEDICVFVPLVGSNYRFHVNCFRCSKCTGFLQDLHYYKKGKEIFCGRHHAELFGKRCAGCDEIIFSDKVIEAEGKNWHAEHFCCGNCDIQLGGDDYVKSRNVIMCNKCFKDQVNAVCFSCKKGIELQGRVVKYREKSWHQKCFICSVCERYLKAEKFIVKGVSIFCLECFENSQSEIKPEPSGSSNCDLCQQPVDVHDPHMSSEGIVWHKSCFSCVFCHQELIGKAFLRHDAGLLCEGCYNERVAHSCHQCSEKIAKGGVKHDGKYFHKDCFNCANCQIQLANIKFSTRKGVNLCFSCNKKSSPLCHQCSKEILGKCFEFKGYNFHPECFSCTGCNKGIAGKEFYQTRGAIYCKKEEVEEIANKLKVKVFRSSVKDNFNISEVFEYLVTNYLDESHRSKQQEAPMPVNQISIIPDILKPSSHDKTKNERPFRLRPGKQRAKKKKSCFS
ncbi:Prickle-like protein 3 isoform X1 [Oopsacas minuta]|uniref:Prickle-like protein 3 isoform X1 n=1 Tax=Oopsacas minuta TaxID=111878 RepID=A0AAV7KE00_9METZ|nr:Prickle-like protein 3 isoform X1 [Oopsacas minuta]